MTASPRKPRVLFVGRTRYALPLPGWLQKKFDALDAEIDYHVLASAAPGAASEGRFELVQPARPRPLDGVLFHALLPFRVARAIRQHRPDAIVAEDPHIAAATLLGRRLAGRPVPRLVAEVHGNWRLGTRLYGSPARRLFAPLADALDSLAVRRADAVRALSPYTARLVEEVRGRPPDAAFPTYSDLSAFTGPRKPLPQRPTALFVGVLERYKGIDTLAAAWPRVASALPEARLVVVGRGSRRPLIEALGVEHVEELSPEDVAARMNDSWVLLLPSRFEGLGRVVIESFARGRGVIGGRAGGILDLVRDDEEGLLVEPGNVAGLTAALERVLADRALAERLGSAAARRFEDWRSTPEEFAARVRSLVDASLN
jgi:glycosyltransferase involved in cell wall biosynthesis